MRYIRPACGRMVRFAERGTMRGSAKRFDAHARADYALPPPSVGVKAASRHVAFPHRGARETVHPALGWLGPWFRGLRRVTGRRRAPPASGRGGPAGCARRLGRHARRGCDIAEGICGREYRRGLP
jgi:hypothetical protein